MPNRRFISLKNECRIAETIPTSKRQIKDSIIIAQEIRQPSHKHIHPIIYKCVQMSSGIVTTENWKR